MFNPNEDTYSEILLGAVNEEMKAARAAMRYHVGRYEKPEFVSDSDLDSLLGLFPNTSSTIYPTSVAKSYRRRKRPPTQETRFTAGKGSSATSQGLYCESHPRNTLRMA